MTNNNFIDGKWYLVRITLGPHMYYYRMLQYIKGPNCLGNYIADNMPEGSSWVLFDPEKTFNQIKHEQDKSYSETEGKK